MTGLNNWVFSFTNDELKLNRVLLFAAGLLYPFFGYFYHSLHIESLPMFEVRLLMGLVWLTVALLLEISPFLRKHLQAIIEVSAYLSMSHMIYLTWISNYSFNYAFGLLAAFFILGTVFKKTLHLNIF